MQKVKKGRSSTLRGSQACGAQQTLFYRCRQSLDSATEASFAEADAQGAKLAGGLRQWNVLAWHAHRPRVPSSSFASPLCRLPGRTVLIANPKGNVALRAACTHPGAKLRGSCAPVCTWLMLRPSLSYQRMLSKKESFTVSKRVIFKTSVLLVLLVVLTSRDVKRVMDKFLLFLGRYFHNL